MRYARAEEGERGSDVLGGQVGHPGEDLAVAGQLGLVVGDAVLEGPGADAVGLVVDDLVTGGGAGGGMAQDEEVEGAGPGDGAASVSRPRCSAPGLSAWSSAQGARNSCARCPPLSFVEAA